MPTANVTSNCTERLQEIADLLAKARKVLVVTGAGVSTNAGIPDFRSENGLYALIQAQYDAAAVKSSEPDFEGGPPAKRRRLARSASATSLTALSSKMEGRKLRSSMSFCSDTQADATKLDEPSSNSDTNPISSQSSVLSGRRSLPNLKGKDLFDSMIWSDPFTTSIFYTFISSLRKKVAEDIKETTKTHQFLKTLRDSGRLVRVYTQNIDGLEAREGLSMDLSKGPGSRVRFGAKIPKPKEAQQDTESESGNSANRRDGVGHLDRGVECVPLHGGLESLRCGLCARLSSWEEEDRHLDTLAGDAPDCPHCTSANATRENRGRRSLAIGRLRPDVVLYGEEHPLAHQIGPLVTHDISLAPDVLLILGTSLRVHGLKLMVREFAKAVHTRGGKVVFVNQTKPPDSIWGDVIDFWVESDCDWWVQDVEERRKDIWEPQCYSEEKEQKPKTAPKNPQSLRRDTTSGAYLIYKIMQRLGRLSGRITDEVPELPEQQLLDAQLLGADIQLAKSNNITQKRPRNKTDTSGKLKVRACVVCRSRKIKCDGAQPSCNTCTSREKQCQYPVAEASTNKHKHRTINVLPDRMRSLSPTSTSQSQFFAQKRSLCLPILPGLGYWYPARTILAPISNGARKRRPVMDQAERSLPSPPTSDECSPAPTTPRSIRTKMSIGNLLSSPCA